MMPARMAEDVEEYFPLSIDEPRVAEDSYAVAAHYSQEPDDDSLGQKKSWQDTCKTYMTATERIVAEMRWFKEHNSHLDEKNRTLCIGTMYKGGYTQHYVDFWFGPIEQKVLMTATQVLPYYPPDHGVREVITKNTKV